jgi:hypothetical protein
MPSTYESSTLIPPGATAFIPPDATPALALAAGAFSLPPKNCATSPIIQDVWSTSEPTLHLRNLLHIPLLSPEFYRSLNKQAKAAWMHGARSLQGLHPGVLLPFWFIPFAIKMTRVSEAQDNWRAARTFLESLEQEGGGGPNFAHVIPAADRMMEVLPYDAEVGKEVLGGDLAALLSTQPISGALVNLVVKTLTERMRILGESYSHIFICNSDEMRYFRMDKEWDAYESSTRLKHVSLAASLEEHHADEPP